MAEQGEIAIGRVERAALSGVLTAIHRGGFGNVTRVIDPARGDALGQLRRAGVQPPADFTVSGADQVAVVINASARTAMAVDLLRRSGAETAWAAARIGSTAPPTFDQLAARNRLETNPVTSQLAD